MQERLIDLHSRVHRGTYRAQPSRGVYIEKADGRQRPLGVAALEDKIIQQAAITVLNEIYEEDFLGFSYGFRPGRSQHQALDTLFYVLRYKKVNYVLDADIRGFFDNLDKGWLIKFVEHRVDFVSLCSAPHFRWFERPVKGRDERHKAAPALSNQSGYVWS